MFTSVIITFSWAEICTCICGEEGWKACSGKEGIGSCTVLDKKEGMWWKTIVIDQDLSSHCLCAAAVTQKQYKT